MGCDVGRSVFAPLDGATDMIVVANDAASDQPTDGSDVSVDAHTGTRTCADFGRCVESCAPATGFAACLQGCARDLRPSSQVIVDAVLTCLRASCDGGLDDNACVTSMATLTRCMAQVNACVADQPPDGGVDAGTDIASDLPDGTDIASDIPGVTDIASDIPDGTDIPDVEAPCPLGTLRCGAACVNTSDDTLHCGMCSRACPAGRVCRQGTCEATCASGNTLCGIQCVTLGDNTRHCGRCDNACAAGSVCSRGMCVDPRSVDPVGCADGTREAFMDERRFPTIAACAGAWALPGIFPAIPASAVPACATLGNSSAMAPANGAGCASSNLCAPGWRICNGGDVLARTAERGCAADTFPSQSFFAASVSGPGCFQCALRSGTVTGPSCLAFTCTPPPPFACRESGDLNNDFFGCGDLGGALSGPCDGLDRVSGDNCDRLTGPWSCGGSVSESRTVTKTGSANGGVLCCRD